MATNQFSPFGFRPMISKFHLGQGNGEYKIASGYASSIYQFDLVKQAADGSIQVAGVGDTPIGMFMGYRVHDRGKQGSLTDLIPYKKNFVGGTTSETGQSFQAIVDDDPSLTVMAQSIGTIAEADRGAAVDLVLQPPSTVFGRSGMCVGQPGQSYYVTSVTVDAGGSGYTSAPTLTVSGGAGTGVTLTAVLTGDAVSSVVVNYGGYGYASGSPPTVTASGGGGTGATFTAVLAQFAAPSQFRIERILEQPIHNVSNGLSQGFGLSSTGANAYVELSFLKHQRGGTSLGVAV